MTRTRTLHVLAIFALVLWWVQPLAAAGQDGEATLLGEFAVTIAAEDVPPELIDGASLIGRWQITFTADGAYLLGRQDVGPLVRGRFETDGDQLTLHAETGVLACESVAEAEAAATYTWQLDGERLQLVASEEPCARRRLLLTTRTLSIFAACPRQTLVSAVSAASTPIGDVSTLAKDDADSPTRPRPEAPVGAIDTVLRQMSDCWATRTPDRFLQLLSRGFRATQEPDDSDGVRRFALAMGAPIVWERVSDVELVDASHISVNVRQTSGDNIDVVRYAFVYEDGAWRWDGIAGSP